MGMVVERDQLQPGDLVFLGAPSGEPYHVALYIGKGMVVVAPHRGALIGEVPLDSVPWDGFARIWSPRRGLITGSFERAWPKVPREVLRDSLHGDRLAAARALLPRTPAATSASADADDEVVPDRPAPPAPEKRDQAPAVADLRGRAGLRWAAGANASSL
jgi:hypothetical protein